MDDLIDRRKTIKLVENWYNGLIVGSVQGLVKRLEALPCIHTKIITCNHCKYAIRNQGELWICNHPENNAWRVDENFYCGRAERQEDGFD